MSSANNHRHCAVCNKQITAHEQQGVVTLTASDTDKAVTFCSGACFHTAVSRLTSLDPATHPRPRRRRTR